MKEGFSRLSPETIYRRFHSHISGLSDEALLWMMEQVRGLGLALDKENVEGGIYPNYREPFDNQAKWPFNVGGTILRDVVGEFSDLHESVK